MLLHGLLSRPHSLHMLAVPNSVMHVHVWFETLKYVYVLCLDSNHPIAIKQFATGIITSALFIIYPGNLNSEEKLNLHPAGFEVSYKGQTCMSIATRTCTCTCN